MSLLGEKGFRETGIISANLAHKLSKLLADKGIKTLNNQFFNEFVIEVANADAFLSKLKSAGILGGIKLNDKNILICTTEMNSEEELNNYINAI